MTDKKPTMLRLPEEMYEKLKLLAIAEHRSMNMEIEYIIASYIAEYEKKNGELS